MWEVPRRLCAAHRESLLNNSLEGCSRIIGALAVKSQRAQHAVSQEKNPIIDNKLARSEVGDLIGVTKGKAIAVMK